MEQGGVNGYPVEPSTGWNTGRRWSTFVKTLLLTGQVPDPWSTRSIRPPFPTLVDPVKERVGVAVSLEKRRTSHTNGDHSVSKYLTLRRCITPRTPSSVTPTPRLSSWLSPPLWSHTESSSVTIRKVHDWWPVCFGHHRSFGMFWSTFRPEPAVRRHTTGVGSLLSTRSRWDRFGVLVRRYPSPRQRSFYKNFSFYMNSTTFSLEPKTEIVFVCMYVCVLI